MNAVRIVGYGYAISYLSLLAGEEFSVKRTKRASKSYFSGNLPGDSVRLVELLGRIPNRNMPGLRFVYGNDCRIGAQGKYKPESVLTTYFSHNKSVGNVFDASSPFESSFKNYVELIQACYRGS